MKTWTQKIAIDLCVAIEAICVPFGCHVALTGGTLYKEEPRKDCDILFYRIRQTKEIDVPGLLSALAAIGIIHTKDHGWVQKAVWDGRPIDLFFPEHKDGEYQRENDEAIPELNEVAA